MTIDTSTIAGKIAVMQAFEDGQAVETCYRYSENTWFSMAAVSPETNPTWDWLNRDYRIKPQPREYWLCWDNNTNGSKSCPWVYVEAPILHWDNVIHVREVV